MTQGTEAAVAFRGTAKAFGAVRAVDGIDLDIAPGETVALLGRNGAGKSTTISLLLGLTEPDAGTVRLFGAAPSDAVRAGRVGAMLQEARAVPRVTVRELVAFVAARYPSPLPVAEALELAGIAELAGRRVDRLSGGQTQRVRFAVALAGNPSLIVLDEPTAALDVEARHAFWASMRAYALRGHTVLFSTHHLEEADAFADRILVVDRGRIIADGTGEELRRAAGGSSVSVDLVERGRETADRPGAPEPGITVAQSTTTPSATTPNATAPNVTALAPDTLALLPGVRSVEVLGGRARLRTDDSDATVIALAGLGAIRGLEVTPASLDDAFLALTSRHPDPAPDVTSRNPVQATSSIPEAV